MKRKSRSIILLFFCLCLVVGLGGEGAKAALDVKIGYVDLERIFNEYEKTKELEVKLKMENEADQEMLSERRQIIEKEIDKLEEELKTQALMLSDSAREEKQAEIERKAEELDEFSAYIEQRNQDREAKYTNDILNDLQVKLPSIIESIAEKEGYRFVFDRRSLFYVTPEKEFNLTDKVVAQLNEEYKAKTESGE